MHNNARTLSRKENPSVKEGVRREVERVVEEICREITSEKEARNIRRAIGIALMVLGAVMVVSTIWPNIVDTLRNLWAFVVGYYKMITGITLLAVRINSDSISYWQR